MKKNKGIIISSGNVFADLEFSQPEEMLAKAKLAHQINSIIKEKKLTQAAAAKLLDLDQPKISSLNTGKLAGFSFERLIKLLNILEQDITIIVSPKKSSKVKSMVSVNIKQNRKKTLPQKPRESTVNSSAIYAKKKDK